MSKREGKARADAKELLDLFGLAHLADVEAGRLAYGPRKMVDIVRATISRPSVLLLDEPSSGLDRAERARIENMLLMIHKEFQIPMMIVEHHMDLVRAVAHRVLGLASGSVALQGPTSEVLDSAEFRATMTGDMSATRPEGGDHRCLNLTAAVIGGLTLGAIYSLVTLGIVIIFRATETFNFAHGSFMLLAALIVGRLQSGSSLPFAVLALISLGIVGALGAMLFRFVLRSTVGRPHFVAVIATLGFAAVADGVIGIVFPQTQYTITIPGLSTGSTTIFGATFSTASLEVSAFAVVLTVALVLVFRYTSFGVRIRAAGQNSLLASQGGINIHWVYSDPGPWPACSPASQASPTAV